MPCDGGAHAPPERHLCGFEIWAFWLLSNFLADTFARGAARPRDGFQGLESGRREGRGRVPGVSGHP
eukprot:3449910-Prymnesium_polylepis.1